MTTSWMRSPWAPYWIGLIALPIVTFWVLFMDRLLGDWGLLLPLAIAVFCLGALVRAAVIAARRSTGEAVRGTLVAVGAPIGLWAALILVSSLSPVFNDPKPRARVGKAQADVRSIASAVSMYAAHMGRLPTDLSLVTESSRNAKGETAGAFLAVVPTPPQGWSSAYYFATSADGTFTVSAEGDSTTARVP